MSRPVVNDRPRSACNISRLIQVTYCTTIGRSRPWSRSNCAICCSLAWSPSTMRAGESAIDRVKTNRSRLTTTSENAENATRRNTIPNIVLAQRHIMHVDRQTATRLEVLDPIAPQIRRVEVADPDERRFIGKEAHQVGECWFRVLQIIFGENDLQHRVDLRISIVADL